MALMDPLEETHANMEDSLINGSFQIIAILRYVVYLPYKLLRGLWHLYLYTFYGCIQLLLIVVNFVVRLVLMQPPVRLFLAFCRGKIVLIDRLIGLNLYLGESWAHTSIGLVLYRLYLESMVRFRQGLWHSLYCFWWRFRVFDLLFVLLGAVLLYEQTLQPIPLCSGSGYILAALLGSVIADTGRSNVIWLIELLAHMCCQLGSLIISFSVFVWRCYRWSIGLKKQYWFRVVMFVYSTYWHWFLKLKFFPAAVEHEWETAVPAVKERPQVLKRELPQIFRGVWRLVKPLGWLLLGVFLIDMTTVMFGIWVQIYSGFVVDRMKDVTIETYHLVLIAICLALIMVGLEKVVFDLCGKLYNIFLIKYAIEKLMIRSRRENRSRVVTNSAHGHGSLQTIFQNGKEGVYHFAMFGTTQPAYFVKSLGLFGYYLYVYPPLMLLSAALMVIDVLFAFYMDAKVAPLNKKMVRRRNRFWAEVEQKIDSDDTADQERIDFRYEAYRRSSVRFEGMKEALSELVLQMVSLITIYGCKIALIWYVAIDHMTFGQFTTTLGLVLSTQTPSNIYMHLMRLVMTYRSDLHVLFGAIGISTEKEVRAT